MRPSVLLPNAFSARCSAEDPGGSVPLVPPLPVSPQLRGPSAACPGMAQGLAEPNANEKLRDQHTEQAPRWWRVHW